jgi:RNA polymerase sigma-70 factor (ECF subfamily)
VRSDRNLAEAILEGGDEGAFRTLYRRHTPRLYQLVLRLVGGAEADAEDLVQETWLRVCRKLDGFRWEAAFPTWLTAIGVRVAQDALRRRGRSVVAACEDPPEFPVPPPAVDERIDLERGISLLPARLRQVLVLHDVEGMTHEEIADLLEIAEGTSKSRLSSARKSLRVLLAGCEEKRHARR